MKNALVWLMLAVCVGTFAGTAWRRYRDHQHIQTADSLIKASVKTTEKAIGISNSALAAVTEKDSIIRAQGIEIWRRGRVIDSLSKRPAAVRTKLVKDSTAQDSLVTLLALDSANTELIASQAEQIASYVENSKELLFVKDTLTSALGNVRDSLILIKNTSIGASKELAKTGDPFITLHIGPGVAAMPEDILKPFGKWRVGPSFNATVALHW